MATGRTAQSLRERKAVATLLPVAVTPFEWRDEYPLSLPRSQLEPILNRDTSKMSAAELREFAASLMKQANEQNTKEFERAP